jgi:hypothetical protein
MLHQRYPGYARLEDINHACCGVFTSWVNHGWASLPVGKLGCVLSTVLLICIINTLIKFPLFSSMSWLPSKLCNIRTWSVCNKCRRICVYIDPLIQLNHVRQSLGASSLLSIRFTYMRAVFLAPREWSRWCYALVACIFKYIQVLIIMLPQTESLFFNYTLRKLQMTWWSSSFASPIIHWF